MILISVVIIRHTLQHLEIENNCEYGVYFVYMLWTQRAFGPDASGPRDFWSGRVRTKTSGPNTPKIKLSLQGALGPRPLVPTHL